MNKRILISLLVLLTISFVCAASILCFTGGIFLLGGDRLVSEQLQPGSGQPPLATFTPSPTPQVTPPSLLHPTPTLADETRVLLTPSPVPLDPVVLSQMEQIERQVSRLRGLNPLQPVKRHVYSPDDLRRHVEEEFFIDYLPDEVADDVRLLTAFGLVEVDFDLHQFYLDLYSEQIAGFYDSKTKEMYIVQGQSFSGPERSTYAHEFTHVLQDQHFDLRDGLNLNREYCQKNTEYCAAVTALIEGDAVLTEQHWLYIYGSPQDRLEIEAFYEDYRSPVYDQAPSFMREDFAFPYLEGVEFVLTLFEAGEFAAIDAAYLNPPISTEMILHPEKYPHELPVDVWLPEFDQVLDRPLRELDRGVMGEWYTYLLLAHGRDEAFRLPEDDARQAAAGWGGDAYAVYWDETVDQVVLVLSMLWDNQAEAREFQNAIQSYAGLRFGRPTTLDPNGLFTTWESTPDGAVILSSSGLETLWVIAPTLSDAHTIMQAVIAFESAGVR